MLRMVSPGVEIVNLAICLTDTEERCADVSIWRIMDAGDFYTALWSFCPCCLMEYKNRAKTACSPFFGTVREEEIGAAGSA